MLLFNAHITRYERRSGTRGDGRAAYEQIEFSGVAALPCEAAEPSARQVARAEAHGVQADRSVDVSAALLAGQSIEPRVGDRLSLIFEGGSGGVYEVVEASLRPAPGVGLPMAPIHRLALRRSSDA